MANDKFDQGLKVAIFLALFLVVVVLAVVLGLVWSMPDLPTTAENDKLCLPNEQGALQCGNTADQLHDFLQRAIKVAYKEKVEQVQREQAASMKEKHVRLSTLMAKYFIEMKPAAKLTGTDIGNITDWNRNVEMAPIREWVHGRGLYDTLGFERFGMRYRNGRLVVPVAGTYFVYSKVDLFEPLDMKTGKPDIQEANKPIKHGIYKFNILDEVEEEVVSSVQPHTVSTNKFFNSYSSYISSLVDLKAGNELSVKVSNLTYLRYPRENTFGVFLI